jgi:hypothetical protein
MGHYPGYLITLRKKAVYASTGIMTESYMDRRLGFENAMGDKATREATHNPKTVVGLLLKLYKQAAVNVGSASQPSGTARRRSDDMGNTRYL